MSRYVVNNVNILVLNKRQLKIRRPSKTVGYVNEQKYELHKVSFAIYLSCCTYKSNAPVLPKNKRFPQQQR